MIQRISVRLFLIVPLAAVCLISLSAGCRHAIPEPPELPIGGGGGGQEEEPVDTCDPGTAYFQQEVLPIFVQYCTMSGCHNSSTDENGEIDLTSWNAIMASDVIDGDLWQALTEDMSEDDNMPPDTMNQLSADQLATIQAWLAQGAQNNSCEGGCDTSNVTYSGSIVPIIQDRCQGCHSGSTPQGGLDLTSWGTLNGLAMDGTLAGAVQHQNGYVYMPPTGPMLSQCRIDQVISWIQDGAPNN